jgi:1-acyl-sn-glycerol-3-phosphate acyltransferase
MRPLFRFFYTPKIIGAENIPQDCALVIAGNHKHVYDQCLTIMATKRVIHYMAKKEYFEGKLAPFFRLVGCIPVDRSKKDISSAMSAMKVLKKGGAVGIFPEGTRNKTDDFLLRFKTGAVTMAKKSDAYILPFGLTGDWKFRSKDLTVRFGKPFKVGDMTVQEANEKLYHEVESLMLENLDENKKIKKHA